MNKRKRLENDINFESITKEEDLGISIIEIKHEVDVDNDLIIEILDEVNLGKTDDETGEKSKKESVYKLTIQLSWLS